MMNSQIFSFWSRNLCALQPPFSHARLVSLISHVLIPVFLRNMQKLKGFLHSSVGYGEPGALPQAQQSTISSIVTHTPHWAGTRTGEELLLESSSLSGTTPQKGSFSCRSLQCSRSRKQEHGRETRLSQLLSVFITFSLKDGTFKTTSLTIYKKTP